MDIDTLRKEFSKRSKDENIFIIKKIKQQLDSDKMRNPRPRPMADYLELRIFNMMYANEYGQPPNGFEDLY